MLCPDLNFFLSGYGSKEPKTPSFGSPDLLTTAIIMTDDCNCYDLNWHDCDGNCYDWQLQLLWLTTVIVMTWIVMTDNCNEKAMWYIQVQVLQPYHKKRDVRSFSDLFYKVCSHSSWFQKSLSGHNNTLNNIPGETDLYGRLIFSLTQSHTKPHVK